MNYIENMINSKLINLHTAFVGKVTDVRDTTALIQPLTYSKSVSGTLIEQAPVAAFIPENVKIKQEEITYVKNATLSDGSLELEKETKTFMLADELKTGDVVFCGVSERDITESSINGSTIEPTRHHDMNDCVVLAVLKAVSE